MKKRGCRCSATIIYIEPFEAGVEPLFQCIDVGHVGRGGISLIEVGAAQCAPHAVVQQG